MQARIPYYVLGLFLAGLIAFPAPLEAAVVFRPAKKGRYAEPGQENVSASAQQLFESAKAAEAQGSANRAMKDYRTLVRRYPKDVLANEAAYRYAVLQEKHGDAFKAAAAYRVVVENYPKSANFNEAIEAQFRIGEEFMNGKKVRLLGIPIRSSFDKAIGIFQAIVRTAPYGKYTARAQFNIGRVKEKQGDAQGAVAAYTSVVEKFPNDPVAADAQYQIGYLWYRTTRTGTYDSKAVKNAKTGFEDFLFRYPKSEKGPQARENLATLEQKQTSDAFQIARFYDKQKNYRAAVIYYNDVIRQQPGSKQSERAKERVAQLRAKVGDAALQSPELTAQTAKKPKTEVARKGPSGMPEEDMPAMRTSPDDVAPLPPPEADESLPPPASLTPDTTLAPDVSTASPSPTPEATPTPEE